MHFLGKLSKYIYWKRNEEQPLEAAGLIISLEKWHTSNLIILIRTGTKEGKKERNLPQASAPFEAPEQAATGKMYQKT